MALNFFLVVNIYIHFSEYPLRIYGYDLHNIRQNCIKPDLIITSYCYNHEVSYFGMHIYFKSVTIVFQVLLNRLILSSVIHVDDTHLYYNMLSLTWKGD